LRGFVVGLLFCFHRRNIVVLFAFFIHTNLSKSPRTGVSYSKKRFSFLEMRYCWKGLSPGSGWDKRV
jgi:hypothetical protein